MSIVATALAVIVSGSWVPVIPRHHHHRRPRPKPPPPMSTALASWYEQDGPGACGYGAQTGLRFANRTLRCGTRVLFCHAGCVTATMSDRGPYVYSRLFDLNANLRRAIGCSDLCSVRWRLA